MNADWRFDDDALDGLIRRATETVDPPAGFTQRVNAAIDSDKADTRRSHPFRRLSPVLAAAAVLALLFIGWRVQTLIGPVPTMNTPVVVNTEAGAPESGRAVVRVSFEEENDAIVIREPSSNPDVTIMWIHPVASQHASAPDTPNERETTDPSNQMKKGSDS